MTHPSLPRRTAMLFIVLLGIVSLWADVTYEGARSIVGPYLGLLGASALVVGIVSGLGEFLGYGVRLAGGYLLDRTSAYWSLVFVGYGVNLLAVPLLALAGNWQTAALLVVIERIGKGIRAPARDAMLSHASSSIGRGWGFGLHEALDQTGAVMGPLLMAGVLAYRADYRLGFAILLIPAAIALSILLLGRFLYPHPRTLETESAAEDRRAPFPRRFRLYVLAAALLAAGYADFPLIAYHFQQTELASDAAIPIFYAVAMGVDAFAALAFGRLYDRFGSRVMAAAVLLSSTFVPLAFLGNYHWALGGMVLWGIGMGAQESILRAAIGDLVPASRRGAAYGIFNAAYGVAWFAGSAVMGALYSLSLPALVLFSAAIQLGAVPVFLAAGRTKPA